VIGNKIVTAKKVIRGLYPELRGRSLQVIVQDKSSLDYLEGTPGIFALWIFEPVNAIAETVKQCPAFLLEPINSKAPITNKCPPFLLSTSFTFTRKGTIFEISSGGSTVNMERLGNVRQQVDLHPEWSDKDIEDVLRKSGARFGPQAKRDLFRLLPIEVFKQLLGEVQIASVIFSTRNPIALLEWEVTLSVHRRGENDLQYIATFEPFEGKMIHLFESRAK